LKINKTIFDEKFKVFQTLAETTLLEQLKVEKKYQSPVFLQTS